MLKFASPHMQGALNLSDMVNQLGVSVTDMNLAVRVMIIKALGKLEKSQARIAEILYRLAL